MADDTKPHIKSITEPETPDFVELIKTTKKKAGRPPGAKNKNWEYKKKQREQAKAKDKMWKKGVLSWKLDTSQMDLYNDYYTVGLNRCVWSLSRQTGKTWTVCVIALEEALKFPGIRMAYIAPELNDAKDLTEQTFDQICEDAPIECIPKFNSQKNRWEWDNGSFLKVVGTDNKNYKKIRGRKYNRVFLDEFCFMDDFQKVFFTCVKPTMTSVPDSKTIFISTPPETADHESNMILDTAEENETLIKKTIFECPRFSHDYIMEEIVADYAPLGGLDAVEFRREFMVERIPDITKLVLPEVNPSLIPKIVAKLERPPHYNIIESFDWGVLDNNAGIFAYINYDTQVLVIEDEMFIDGIHHTTEDIARDIKRIEEETWGHDNGIARWCDNNLQIINDMGGSFDLWMCATAKHNRSAAIMTVRRLIANGQIIINPKCVNLIEQIQSATWSNAKKKEFSRRNGHHYDLVAALIYLVRNAQLEFSENPYPANYDTQNLAPGSFIKRNKKQKSSGNADILREVFTIRKKRR